MGNPDEQVLVVPREALVPGDGWLADLEREGGPDVDALRGRLASARDVLTDGA